MSFAKTTRPVLRSVVMRERLFSIIDKTADRPVIWVNSPPGSGKTTLVSSYIESRQLTHVWYRIDAGDADIASFFHYMTEATRRVRRSAALHMPAFSPGDAIDIPTFARHYFRQLFDGVGRPLVIIFDNYQDVPPHSIIHDAIRIGLSELPKRLRVVFISRAGPSEGMARLVADDGMIRIGPDQLRFTLDEVQQMAALRNSDISASSIIALHEQTDGWAAGLVLMIEDARMRGALGPWQGMPSAPKVVFDYLSGEVFAKFDESVQQFLLRAAAMPQMTSGMAKQLTGNANARQILANLSLNNYFVAENRLRREVEYQFHPLFREFLLERAAQTLSLEAQLALRRKAAILLSGEGQFDAAALLLFDIGAVDEVARLVQEHAGSLLEQGRSSTVLQWLQRLPAAMTQADPWLLYWSGASRLPALPGESLRYFIQAHGAFKDPEPDSARGLVLSSCGVLNSMLVAFNDFAEAPEWVDSLSARLNDANVTLSAGEREQSTLTLFTSMALTRPDHGEFASWTDRALAIARDRLSSPKGPTVSPQTLALLAICAPRGMAAELMDRMQLDAERPGRTPEGLVRALSTQAFHALVAGQLQDCRDLAGRGESLVTEGGVTSLPVYLPACCAAAELCDGNVERARLILEDADVAARGRVRIERCLLECLHAWLDLQLNETMSANEHMRTAFQLCEELGIPLLKAACSAGLAITLQECGDGAGSRVEQRKAIEAAEISRQPWLSFMATLVAADLEWRRHDRSKCLDLLRSAFRLGQQHGFESCLWWRPAGMAALCVLAFENGIEEQYLKYVVHRRRLVPQPPPVNVENWPWRFKVCTLGEFRISRDDKLLTPLRKSDQRPLELLKVLVAFGGRRVSTSDIESALWPRVDSDYAHKSFTIALHRLRRFLGEDDAIQLRDSRLSLNSAICWLDVWALEDFGQKVESAIAMPNPDCGSVANVAGRMLELYRGPFLADSAVRVASTAMRDLCRTRMLNGLRALAGAMEKIGQPAGAVNAYERAIRTDPEWEGFYQGLMLHYEQAGDRDAVTEVYRRCCDALARSSQHTPSAGMEAVYRKIAGTV